MRAVYLEPRICLGGEPRPGGLAASDGPSTKVCFRGTVQDDRAVKGVCSICYEEDGRWHLLATTIILGGNTLAGMWQDPNEGTDSTFRLFPADAVTLNRFELNKASGQEPLEIGAPPRGVG